MRAAFGFGFGLPLGGGEDSPAVDWNFAGGALPSALTFSRASTATYYNAAGTLVTAASGSPRLTYDPVTHAALGLLVEEQRTNLLTYSEALDNAAWSRSAVTVTANAGVAPDGTTTADLVAGDGTSASHYVFAAAVFPSGAVHTLSAYAKQATAQYVHILIAGENPYAQIDLASGSVLYSSAGTATNFAVACTSVGAGWWRISVTAMQSSGVARAVRIYPIAAPSNTASPTETTSAGVYLWGLQLEAGAFATSYIPTGAASATRAADVVTCTGAAFSQWFNPSEGTLVVEVVMPNANLGPAAVLNFVYVGDGPGNEYIKAYQYETVFGAAIRHGGAWQADISSTKTAGVVEKLAIAWAANDAAVAIRGAIVGTDSTVSVPTGIDRLTLGTGTSGVVAYTIKRVRYWRKRITNAQLQALTA